MLGMCVSLDIASENYLFSPLDGSRSNEGERKNIGGMKIFTL